MNGSYHHTMYLMTAILLASIMTGSPALATNTTTFTPQSKLKAVDSKTIKKQPKKLNKPVKGVIAPVEIKGATGVTAPTDVRGTTGIIAPVEVKGATGVTAPTD